MLHAGAAQRWQLPRDAEQREGRASENARLGAYMRAAGAPIQAEAPPPSRASWRPPLALPIAAARPDSRSGHEQPPSRRHQPEAAVPLGRIDLEPSSSRRRPATAPRAGYDIISALAR